jgi:hypothetical protein
MVADTYSAILGWLDQGTGNNNNTWGDNCDISIFPILEKAISGLISRAITGGTTDLSLTPPPAGPTAAIELFQVFTGTLLSNHTIQVPNLYKWWIVQNQTAGAFTLKFKTPSGSASDAIPQNSGFQLVHCDGANGIFVWPFNTKQIRMPDGLVSTPPYSFVNETTTGWYRAGTQDFRLAIAGVDVLQITGAGASSPNLFNPSTTIALTGINIIGATQLTAPDTADTLPIYDLSATANKRISVVDFFKVIDTLTVKVPLAADEVVIYDAAGTTSKKATITGLFAAIDALTAKTSPVAADELAIYDVAGTTSKKSTIAQVRAAIPAFTVSYLLSGTGATYTTPANCRLLRVKYIGAGGGGGSTGSNTGNTGGTTTFNGVDAAGGPGGPPGNSSTQNSAAGGTGGAGSASLRLPGSAGQTQQNGADFTVPGSAGASGIFGLGAGRGTAGGGGAGGANTGAGGAGGAGTSSAGGGASGEYVELVIPSPSATYTYTVGVGGTGATGGQIGGAGGSGIIIVEEYY